MDYTHYAHLRCHGRTDRQSRHISRSVFTSGDTGKKVLVE